MLDLSKRKVLLRGGEREKGVGEGEERRFLLCHDRAGVDLWDIASVE